MAVARVTAFPAKSLCILEGFLVIVRHHIPACSRYKNRVVVTQMVSQKVIAKVMYTPTCWK